MSSWLQLLCPAVAHSLSASCPQAEAHARFSVDNQCLLEMQQSRRHVFTCKGEINSPIALKRPCNAEMSLLSTLAAILTDRAHFEHGVLFAIRNKHAAFVRDRKMPCCDQPSAWRLRCVAAACRRVPTSPAQPPAKEVHKPPDELNIDYSTRGRCDDEESHGQAIV